MWYPTKVSINLAREYGYGISSPPRPPRRDDGLEPKLLSCMFGTSVFQEQAGMPLRQLSTFTTSWMRVSSPEAIFAFQRKACFGL